MVNIDLAIIILSYGADNRIYEQINHLEHIHEKLERNYKKRIRFGLSINGYKGSTTEIFSNTGKNLDWLNIVIHPYNLSFDQHLKVVYDTFEAKFIWFCALDDFIRDDKCITQIVDLITSHSSVSGIICTSSSDKVVAEKRNFKKIDQLNNKLGLLINEGKVSRHIIKRHKDVDQDLDKHIGKGYMHLSLQLYATKKKANSEIIKLKSDMVRTTQKKGSFNNYHPRFAVNVLDALRDTSSEELCRDFYLIHSEKQKINGFKFIIRTIIYGNIYSWHQDMLEDYVQSVYYNFRQDVKRPLVIFWMLLASVTLCIKPKLIVCAIAGLLGLCSDKSVPEYR